MKVKELVEELKKYDQEAEAILGYEKDVGWYAIDKVSTVKPEDSGEKESMVNIGHAIKVRNDGHSSN